jgi:hypothetical protein
MEELDQLYAACIVEYATRQANGLLAGDFYVIGKDARDAFNLPYDEDIFRSALDILKRAGILRVYKREGVPTHYSLRRTDFDNAMIVEGNGQRRYQNRPANAASSAFSAALFGPQSNVASWYGQRESTLLEAYADLGRSYLEQVIDAFEPKLAQVGAGPSEDDGSSSVGLRSDQDVQVQSIQVPASDRTVPINHNDPDYVEIANQLEAVRESVRSTNYASEAERSRIVNSLLAAENYWKSLEMKLVHFKVGILMAAEDAVDFLKSTSKAVVAGLLVDLIKAFAKKHFSIDLDGI